MSETTRYLQFQLSNIYKKIEETEDKIAVIESERKFGIKLTELRNLLMCYKVQRDTLQNIWNFRKGL